MANSKDEAGFLSSLWTKLEQVAHAVDYSAADHFEERLKRLEEQQAQANQKIGTH